VTSRFNVEQTNTADLAAQAAGFESAQAAENAGYDMDRLAAQGKIEGDLLAQAAGWASLAEAEKHMYTIGELREQAKQKAELNLQTTQLESILESQRQQGALDLQDVKTAAALQLLTLEADYKQVIATNAAAAQAFTGYQAALADVLSQDFTPAELDDRTARLFNAFQANMQVLEDISGFDLTDFTFTAGGEIDPLAGEPIEPTIGGEGPGDPIPGELEGDIGEGEDPGGTITPTPTWEPPPELTGGVEEPIEPTVGGETPGGEIPIEPTVDEGAIAEATTELQGILDSGDTGEGVAQQVYDLAVTAGLSSADIAAMWGTTADVVDAWIASQGLPPL